MGETLEEIAVTMEAWHLWTQGKGPTPGPLSWGDLAMSIRAALRAKDEEIAALKEANALNDRDWRENDKRLRKCITHDRAPVLSAEDREALEWMVDYIGSDGDRWSKENQVGCQKHSARIRALLSKEGER
jgi:hypothetical protein